MAVADTSCDADLSNNGVHHSIDGACHPVDVEPETLISEPITVAGTSGQPDSCHGAINQSIVVDDEPKTLISDSFKVDGCGTSTEVGSSHDIADNVNDDPTCPQIGDEGYLEGDVVNFTGRQKRLFELRLKMNEARKSNQVAVVAEKKRKEAPAESRGVSKQKWVESRRKKIGRLLDANGLDMKKAFMLDTQEVAEAKYKKWDKDPAPSGWDVFNQKTLYSAYKKRAKNIKVDLEEYTRMKEGDPEFYRDASSLQYGKIAKVSEEKVEMMVKELKDRDEKRKSFSRRRRFHEEKDIDSINDRNEHFNKKIERAFGKYTLEIKNNLERGTALPD